MSEADLPANDQNERLVQELWECVNEAKLRRHPVRLASDIEKAQLFFEQHPPSVELLTAMKTFLPDDEQAETMTLVEFTKFYDDWVEHEPVEFCQKITMWLLGRDKWRQLSREALQETMAAMPLESASGLAISEELWQEMAKVFGRPEPNQADEDLR